MNARISHDLAGRVALVTGAAGHIGRETCKQLAAAGASIVVLDKDVAAGEQWVRTLGAEHGADAAFVDCDLMDPASFARVRDKVGERFGHLHCLVNNAAFYDEMPGWGVPFEQEGYEAWMRVLRVNLMAPFFLAQACAPLLKSSPGAAIVNVSSIYALVGPDHRLYEGTDMTNPCAYAASKAGMLQLTRWLSTVLAPDIRVNSVTPGGVERGQPEVFQARYLERTPLRRMATEADVASAIVFLLSPGAGYITGQNLVVDGGWTAW